MNVVTTNLAPAIQCQPEGVPQELRVRPQWVCWKYISGAKKPTKCPIIARSGRKADTTDPSTWTSFEEAIATWSESSRYAGVGYVIHADDPFTGIDLDECILQDGKLVPSAQAIVDSLNSYTEISPSGRGIKIFVIGSKPDGSGCKSKRIEGFKETEVYSQVRYFCVTGSHLAGTPLTIEHRQPQLDALCARLWPVNPPPTTSKSKAIGVSTKSDDELIAMASAAQNGDKFRRLWSGDTSMHADDRSSADLALCSILAFWTQRDSHRIDALFRRSGLMRSKWDERHSSDGRTYGQMTVEKAMEGCTDVYSSLRQQPQEVVKLTGPNGVQLIPQRVTASPTRHQAVFAVHVNGRDTEMELTASSTSTGVKKAQDALVDIVTRSGGVVDVDAMGTWLLKTLTTKSLRSIEENLNANRPQPPTESKTGDDMVAIATDYMVSHFELSYVGPTGSVWSERFGRFIARQEFVAYAAPDLLTRLVGAKDYAPPTAADPTKAIRNVSYILKAAWSAIQERLPTELRADLGPTSQAAMMLRQQVIDLWLAPETWMKFEARGDTPAHVERMSLASRVRSLIPIALREPPAWRRVLKGVEAFYRVERDPECAWLAMRADLCRGQIKGQRIEVVRNQTELTTLMGRYGLADSGGVTDRLREDGRQSRVCVLSRSLCDYLINGVDDDLPEGAVTPQGGVAVTALLAHERIDMTTGEVLEGGN